MTDILAGESIHRTLKLQADNCPLTSFPRSVEIRHPINTHTAPFRLHPVSLRDVLLLLDYRARSDQVGPLSHATFSHRVSRHQHSFMPSRIDRHYSTVAVAHCSGSEPSAYVAYRTVNQLLFVASYLLDDTLFSSCHHHTGSLHRWFRPPAPHRPSRASHHTPSPRL
jgi:hypothetical protein